MEKTTITEAKYVFGSEGTNACIIAKFDGQQVVVPVNAPGNRHYDEIQRQVAAGTLTIEDAD
tara:strand:- start:306 stop:491 length:186 start_codon:yes stop_codon:yes gene_type:complete